MIPDEKRTVVHNPIDADVRFTEPEIEDKIHLRRERRSFNVAFISSMFVSKGYLDVAHALAGLPEALEWHADFVGAWPAERERRRFLTLIEHLGIGERVCAHGLVRCRSAIKSLLQDADAFVLPTYYSAEAQPRSIIEALNSATPVIATCHASIPEYVFDGVNGFIVPARSPASITFALERLMDLATWEGQARNARRVYRDMFSPEALGRELQRAVV
jgi:glycosyltransferase involved in cell wall biosynthesis